MKDTQFSSLIDSTFNYLNQIKAASVSLSNDLRVDIHEKQIIGENAKDFAIFLLDLIDIIDKNIDLRFFPALSDLSRSRNSEVNVSALEDLRGNIFDAFYVLNFITPYTKFAKEARTDVNPWGIVSLMDRLCKYLFPSSKPIIRPVWDYDFGYIPITQEILDLPKESSTRTNNLSRALSDHIYESSFYFSLSYPQIETTNILRLAIWAHEIGHYVDSYKGFENILNSVKLRKELPAGKYYSRQVANEVDWELTVNGFIDLISTINPKDEGDISKLISRVSRPIASAIKSWAVEIFADIFSFHLFGPATLFAFVEYAKITPENIDSFSHDEYPPNRIRLKIMFQLYDKWIDGFDSSQLSTKHRHSYRILINEIENIRSYAEMQLDPSKFQFIERFIEEDQNKADMIEFYSWLSSHVNEIMKLFSPVIEELVKNKPNCFVQKTDFEEIFNGVEDLKLDLPPQYNSNSKALALTINTGWIYWLEKRKQFITSMIAVNEMHDYFVKTNNLLYKAIENHEALDWYHERNFIFT